MANPAEAVQIWSGKNRIERLRHEYIREGGGGGVRGHQHAPRESLKFSFSKMHILRIFREN